MTQFQIWLAIASLYFIQLELSWIRKSLEKREKKEEKTTDSGILNSACPCGSNVRIDLCRGNFNRGEYHSKGFYLEELIKKL